jgi:hypothetical protein
MKKKNAGWIGVSFAAKRQIHGSEILIGDRPKKLIVKTLKKQFAALLLAPAHEVFL